MLWVVVALLFVQTSTKSSTKSWDARFLQLFTEGTVRSMYDGGRLADDEVGVGIWSTWETLIRVSPAWKGRKPKWSGHEELRWQYS